MSNQGRALTDEIARKPTPVFGCGLSRTGNTSLCEALRMLGYTAVKYPRTVECIGADFDAAVDITVVAWMEEFDRRFPAAKWILTVRDEWDWINSTREYFNRPVDRLHPPESASFMRSIREAVYGSAEFEEETWIRSFYHHPKRVHAMMANRPDNLLVLDVAQRDAWDVLCSFLGLPRPNLPFPHMNRRKTTRPLQ